MSTKRKTVKLSRRTLLAAGAAAAGGLLVGRVIRNALSRVEYPRYQIALGQNSLRRRILGLKGEEAIDPLDFPMVARSLGIDAVEYVSLLWRDRLAAEGRVFLKEMRQRSSDHGVANRLIAVGDEGNLGDSDSGVRAKAIENHKHWLETAAELGCNSIRVQPNTNGATYNEALNLMADGLYELCLLAQDYRMSVLVENQNGPFSSNADWLVALIERVHHPLAGLLPDFGNFWSDGTGQTKANPYESVGKMMRRSRAVSAKSFGFKGRSKITTDPRGSREMSLDFSRLLDIVTGSGYRGWIAIDYEGVLPETEGIEQTKHVMDRLSIRG